MVSKLFGAAKATAITNAEAAKEEARAAKEFLDKGGVTRGWLGPVLEDLIQKTELRRRSETKWRKLRLWMLTSLTLTINLFLTLTLTLILVLTLTLTLTLILMWKIWRLTVVIRYRHGDLMLERSLP